MLSLCMIVRDEEENLPRLLESVRDLVAETIIVDTGSTDRTEEIAASAGARISHFEWCDDFAAARNHSLSLATGDWILVLDADDEFTRADIPKAEALLARSSKDGVTARQRILYREGRVTFKEQLILVRNRPQYRYEFPVHERIPIDPSMVERSEIAVTHHGYAGAFMAAKWERNRSLLEKMKENANPVARVAASYYLGTHHEEDADLKAACREFQTAGYSKIPCEYRLYAVLGLARCAAQLGEDDYAASLYRVMLESNPKAVEPCLGLAEILKKEGKLEEAQSLTATAKSSSLRILPYTVTE